MFCETGNIPAKLIKEFRKTMERPVLKAAFVEESIYIGDDQLEALSNIKSKDELLGDLLMLLTVTCQKPGVCTCIEWIKTGWRFENIIRKRKLIH